MNSRIKKDPKPKTTTLELLSQQFDNRVVLNLDDLAKATGLSKGTLYQRTHHVRAGRKNVDLPRLLSSKNHEPIRANIIDIAEWIDKKRKNEEKVSPTKKRGRPTKLQLVSSRPPNAENDNDKS